jgi:hypothetical protein
MGSRKSDVVVHARVPPFHDQPSNVESMTRPVLLNNVDHQNLRIITERGDAYGDDVMSALTFPAEFRNVQAHYPIVFRKSADGTTFQPIALFGFQENSNLFLDGDRWDAYYLPLLIDRQPFLIGTAGEELTVHIDLDSPRVSTTAGEPVFLPYGGSTPYLERVNSVLLAIYEGLAGIPAFVTALLEHDLLESFVLDVELAGKSLNRLAGFYTINEERFGALTGDALGKLNSAGHLLPITLAIASLSNFRDLIERQKRRHVRQP